MKCYYDILGIDKTSDQTAIKKAYYKVSLRWHPDKNVDNIAEATEMFKEIQKAYKVLSDMQERSWYDKNRERFMTMSFNSEEELYDLIHTAAYSGFGNDENGFYSVYTHVFNILGEREREAARISGEPIDKIATFGDSDSSYQECVSRFYDFWQGFKTKMSFHWKNKHEVDFSIPRDIRRAMEKENADERNAARKMYNKEIQNFVETVKSRDPRIKLWKEHLKDKAKENEKKAINMKHKAWERSRKQFEDAQPTMSYGSISVDELEETLKSLELEHGKLGGEEKDSDSENLYCIACNKYFKSLPSFSNHEKSKNHNKNLVLLRSQMIQEDDELFSEIMKEDEEIKLEQNDVMPILEELKVEEEGEGVLSTGTVAVDSADDNDARNSSNTDEGAENNDQDASTKADKKRRRRPKTERDATKTEEIKKVSAVDSDKLSCEHCNSDFATRNKLFQHIKVTGHASTKPVPESTRSKVKVKKRK